MRNRLKGIAIMLCVATSAVCASPDAGFAGRWLLTQRASLSGPDYANGVPTQITISAKGDAFDIERKQPGANDAEETITSNYIREDAKAITTPAHNRKTARIERTPDGRGFTETVHLDPADGGNGSRRMIIYTWVLSADGGTLTLVRADKNLTTGEEWSMKGSYIRQAPTVP